MTWTLSFLATLQCVCLLEGLVWGPPCQHAMYDTDCPRPGRGSLPWPSGQSEDFPYPFLRRLYVDFGEKPKLGFTVWGRPQAATADDEPNSAVLCAQSMLEFAEVTVVKYNEGLCSICRRWTLSVSRTPTLIACTRGASPSLRRPSTVSSL